MNQELPFIRPVAICVFRSGDRILVWRGVDPATEEPFFRSFGGQVEFGELAVEALRREILEELSEPIDDSCLLGVLENRFMYNGKLHHELVFVFDARFRNSALYSTPRLSGREASGVELVGEWRSQGEFGETHPPLYPAGLADLLWGTGISRDGRRVVCGGPDYLTSSSS